MIDQKSRHQATSTSPASVAVKPLPGFIIGLSQQFCESGLVVVTFVNAVLYGWTRMEAVNDACDVLRELRPEMESFLWST
jgi:hypothetical protein